MFKKAERQQVKLKLGITGPSGSGKTYSALLIAAGLGGRIAVVDTENGSASLYADIDKGPLAGITFDTLEIGPPYTMDKYLSAIDEAVKARYSVLIIDSISHAWAGEGGLLDKKGALDARGGNSYTNWNAITPEQERFKARILQADIHLIATMRSKQDYILEQNEKGKQAPRKVGMAPIQREGTEYDFAIVLDMAMDHNASSSKHRTGVLLDGKIFTPTKKTGEEILAWVKTGKVAESKPVPPTKPPTTDPQKKVKRPDEFNSRPALPEQLALIQTGIDALHALGIGDPVIWKWIPDRVKKVHGTEIVDTANLSDIEALTIIEYLAKWVEKLTAERKPATPAKGIAAKVDALKKKAGK